MADDVLPPEPGKAVLVTETGAGRFQMRATSGDASFLVDEDPSAGGLGSGPDPYDLLSAALGSCTAMTIRLYADHKAWPLERVRVKVVHHRASLDERDRFERIIDLDGGLDDSQRQRLIEVAEHCPVHKTLDRGSNIATRLGAAESADPPQPRPPEHVIAMDQAALALG
jgi:putative redox protein